MSNLPKDWEADIRQKINEHEFDYVPTAWGEMSVLLDQAIPSGSIGGKNSTSTTVKTIEMSSLIIAVILAVLTIAAMLLLWYQEKNAPAPVLESWSVVVPLQAPELALPTTPQNQAVVTTPQLQRTSTAEVVTTDKVPAEVVLPIMEKIPPARIIQKVILPLPGSTLPDTLISKTPSSGLELPEIQSLRRKRNRRKLFPDVIKKN